MKMVFVGMGCSLVFDSHSEVPFEVVGYTPDFSQERELGLCVPRKELDNQPIYKGWLSPMWDGGKLRYETQEVYDLLSR